MTQEQKDMAILLCGYLRGLWSRIGEKPDPMMVNALRKLKVPERYLPRDPAPPAKGAQ